MLQEKFYKQSHGNETETARKCSKVLGNQCQFLCGFDASVEAKFEEKELMVLLVMRIVALHNIVL